MIGYQKLSQGVINRGPEGPGPQYCGPIGYSILNTRFFVRVVRGSHRALAKKRIKYLQNHTEPLLLVLLDSDADLLAS